MIKRAGILGIYYLPLDIYHSIVSPNHKLSRKIQYSNKCDKEIKDLNSKDQEYYLNSSGFLPKYV